MNCPLLLTEGIGDRHRTAEAIRRPGRRRARPRAAARGSARVPSSRAPSAARSPAETAGPRRTPASIRSLPSISRRTSEYSANQRCERRCHLRCSRGRRRARSSPAGRRAGPRAARGRAVRRHAPRKRGRRAAAASTSRRVWRSNPETVEQRPPLGLGNAEQRRREHHVPLVGGGPSLPRRQRPPHRVGVLEPETRARSPRRFRARASPRNPATGSASAASSCSSVAEPAAAHGRQRARAAPPAGRVARSTARS